MIVSLKPSVFKMFTLVLITLCSAILALWLCVRPRGPSPPMYPGALPLIGHAHLFFRVEPKHLWEIEKRIYKFCEENGGIIQLRLGLHTVYVITDLEASLVVANSCLDKQYVYNFVKDAFNRGLIIADALIWKPHRKILNPTFSHQVLNNFVHLHNDGSKSLVSQLAHEVGKAPIDVLPLLRNNILKNVFRTMLGIKTQENDIKTYSDVTKGIFDLCLNRFQRVWLHLPFVFNMSSLKKKQDELIKTMKNITHAAINERKLELNLNKSLTNSNDLSSDKFKPLLDYLLDLAAKHNTFTDDEISDHLDTIVGAAYDTSSIALTFTLMFIGTYQEIQTKIFKELQEVLGNHDRDVDRHDLPKLVYLEAVIKESLRIIPPVPRFARSCRSPVKLKNYTLPAGCSCIISSININCHPMWGADAEKFRPERWLNPSTLPDNPNAFTSFGLGKRNCIGKLYTMMVMKTYLANILRRFHVTGDINKLETKCDLLLIPINGHHITLQSRT